MYNKTIKKKKRITKTTKNKELQNSNIRREINVVLHKKTCTVTKKSDKKRVIFLVMM